MKQLAGHTFFVVILAFCLVILFSVGAQAAAYTVTTTADNGAGSLRAAIADANLTVEDDEINFSIPSSDPNCTAGGVCTITLTSGQLVVNATSTAGALTITNASGASRLFISGNNTSRVFVVNPGANLSLEGVTITGGYGTVTPAAPFRFGGGIYNNGGTLSLTNSSVSGNFSPAGGGAGGVGGGIYSTGTLTVANSTVSGNNAELCNGCGTSGGGIYNDGGTASLTNSTISGNTARYGGGIYNTGTLTITSSTITANTAQGAVGPGSGGGIFNSASGSLILTNTIVAGNLVINSSSPDIAGGVSPTSSFNLIGGDPKLGSLADNGGPTQTHALLPGSPAIDAGINSGAATDQRGFARRVDLPSTPNAAGGDGTDIGAYELQSSPTAASVTISGRVITSNGRGLFNALVALTNENGETRYARTSINGRYRFNDVAAGSSAVITIVSKRYSFAPQVLMVTGESLNVDFLAQDGLSKR
ncbi:MAG TPA: carboxypeptidase-like regulatory domain-containing protein [Pyrinomonadaceae bacterium]|jgi:hypothetical protein